MEFPLPFGRTMSPAEESIHRMDEKVGYLLYFYDRSGHITYRILYPSVWTHSLHFKLTNICLYMHVDWGFLKIDNSEPQGTHLDYGCWRWCKCHLC